MPTSSSHIISKILQRADLLFTFGLFGTVLLLVLPVPPFLLDAMLAVNIVALTRLTRWALPGMLARKSGWICNVGSTAGLIPLPTFAVYAATKAYVNSFSEALRIELHGSGVRVLALCPGPVETPLLNELLSDPVRRNRRLVHIPMGRFARAEEMANAALFLASDESSFVNASTFLVDGGISAAYITPE